MEIKKTKTTALIGYDTGKIQELNSDPNLTSVITFELNDIIKSLYDLGFTMFLCSMSTNFDLIAAESVLNLKQKNSAIKLLAVIPFVGSDANFNSTEKLRFKTISNCADQVIFTSSTYQENILTIHANYLLENASHLISFYNNEDKTPYIVNCAAKANLPITNIYEEIFVYIGNVNLIKTTLTQYRCPEQMAFYKEGFILKCKDPIKVPFERIKRVRMKNACLLVTLKNDIVFRISTISDDFRVILPEMESDSGFVYWWKTSDSLLRLWKEIKRWF